MRQNTCTVIRAFEQGKPARPAASIWTDGDTIYSYETALLTRVYPEQAADSPLVLNRSSYSTTTSQHQTHLAVHFRPACVLHGFDRGVKASTLRQHGAGNGPGVHEV